MLAITVFRWYAEAASILLLFSETCLSVGGSEVFSQTALDWWEGAPNTKCRVGEGSMSTTTLLVGEKQFRKVVLVGEKQFWKLVLVGEKQSPKLLMVDGEQYHVHRLYA